VLKTVGLAVTRRANLKRAGLFVHWFLQKGV